MKAKITLCCFFLVTNLALPQDFTTVLLTHPDGDYTATDINQLGQISGHVREGFSTHALRRETDGSFVRLEELDRQRSTAEAINDHGDIVGTNSAEDGTHLVVWSQTGGMRELALPPDAGSVLVHDINNFGEVVGQYSSSESFHARPAFWDADGQFHPLPWTGLSAVANAINDSSRIVGTWLDSLQRGYPVMWNPLTVMDGEVASHNFEEIAFLGATFGSAQDINVHGQITGWSSTVLGTKAFIWENGVRTDLGALNRESSFGLGIDNDGQVVGTAFSLGANQLSVGTVDIGWHSDRRVAQSRSLNGTDDVALRWRRYRIMDDAFKTQEVSTDTIETILISEVFQTTPSGQMLGFSEAGYWLIHDNKIAYVCDASPIGGAPSDPSLPFAGHQEVTDYWERLNNLDSPPVLIERIQHNCPFNDPFTFPNALNPNISLILQGWNGQIGLAENHREQGTLELSDWTIPQGWQVYTDGLDVDVMDQIILEGTLQGSGSLNIRGDGFDNACDSDDPDNVVIIGEAQGYVDATITRLLPSAPLDPKDHILMPFSNPVGVQPREDSFNPELLVANFISAEFVEGSISDYALLFEIVASKTGVDIDQVHFAYLFSRALVIEDGSSAKRSLQDLSANISVRAPSLGDVDDPSEYRILQFDCDGNFLGMAGTFVPPDGQEPTSALFTGFMDGILTVSHEDVQLDTCQLLVLASGKISTSTKDHSGIDLGFALQNNHPNPFADLTKIRYSMPRSSLVRVSIHDMWGRSLQVLFNAVQRAGEYEISWDGRDRRGTMLPSGIYYYQIEFDDLESSSSHHYVQKKKLMLLR